MSEIHRTVFNAKALWGYLDDLRETRNMTWKEVAKEANVSVHDIRGLAINKSGFPSMMPNSLARLLLWLDMKFEDFVDTK